MEPSGQSKGHCYGGLMSEEKDFELNPLWDMKPVAVLEDRADVVTGTAVGKQMSSRVTKAYLLRCATKMG